MNIYRYINIRYIIVYVYITIFLERRFFFQKREDIFFQLIRPGAERSQELAKLDVEKAELEKKLKARRVSRCLPATVSWKMAWNMGKFWED
jgi:hypothetical protein